MPRPFHISPPAPGFHEGPPLPPPHGPHGPPGHEWLVAFDDAVSPSNFARVLRFVADGLERGELRLAEHTHTVPSLVRACARLERTPRHLIVHLEVHADRETGASGRIREIDDLVGPAQGSVDELTSEEL